MTQNLDELKKHPSVLRLYLSRLRFQKEGDREYKATCPDHSDSTPSLSLNNKTGTWLFFCFGCQKTGSIIDFVQWMDNCDLKTAINTVEKFCEGSWEGQKEKVDRVFRPATQEVEKKYVAYTLEQWKGFEDALFRSREGQEWLQGRGIAYETAKALRWGFRQDISKFCREDVADQGWMAFPTLEGEVVTCIKYRSVIRKAFARQPNMKTSLYNTNDIDVLEPLFLVEGEPDVASLKQAGFRAVSLPSASTNPTPEMKDMLMQGEYLILAGDCDDAAGTAIMEKLWKELQERTFYLKWPNGIKDANDTLRKTCGGDVDKFRTLVNGLVVEAKSKPMPNVFSLQETLMSSERTNLADHPKRLRFPWKNVDRMAILLPGSVATIVATNTKMGKTAFTMNFTVDAARRHDEVVINYQCELSQDEYAAMVCAYVLRKDRNHLTTEDNHKAARALGNARYYIGRDPTLMSAEKVLDLIEAAVRRLGATVVVLDHIHFICRGTKDDIKEQSYAMQRIKNMAGKYGLKFIVVGQPRKAKQDSRGKSLHISDMKGSETIQSDADAAFAVHREYHKNIDPDNPPEDDYEPRTEVHLMGARSKGDGPVVSELWFFGKYAAFNEVIKEDSPAGEGLFGTGRIQKL